MDDAPFFDIGAAIGTAAAAVGSAVVPACGFSLSFARVSDTGLTRTPRCLLIFATYSVKAYAKNVKLIGGIVEYEHVDVMD